MKRVCTACSRRAGELINPDCPICDGNGYLQLHPAALTIYDPVTVSLAVDVALEAVARDIDAGSTLTDPQAELLAARMIDLETAGLIRRNPTPAAQHGPGNVRTLRRRQCAGQATLAEVATPTQLALDLDPAPHDDALIHAAPFNYAEDDRPMMRGLPVLSANGHPSSLARITDPVDQLTGTRTRHRDGTKHARQAQILVAAIPTTLRKKNRKTA
ncbi:hypothetical protein ACQCSX_04360 [Pseudarthrobacter sp. P1]|uniref:hypothetical protein n=1 Tax=Pseudarthrobacter sp. P1 TaxID=3418418 RepID=UPI003CEFBFBC